MTRGNRNAMLWRIAPGLVVLALLAAACTPQAKQGDAAGNVAAAGEAIADVGSPAGENEATEQRSILRPEVTPTPDAPKPLEPESLTIAFGASGQKLDDAGRQAIDALLSHPVMQAGGAIILSGHSDSRGSDGDNRVASRKRAEAVRAYLVEKGVDEKRIAVIALGETRPIAPNANADGSDDPEGRAKNRRVEIEVRPPAQPSPDPAVRPTP